VQCALAQVWRYFDPGEYAEVVLRDAPLDAGSIRIERVEHVPHLHKLQHLRDAQLDLFDSGPVGDLTFLREAPPVTTLLQVWTSGPVDLAPLARCPALELVNIVGGGTSAGWEVFPTLPKLWSLDVTAADGGRDLSFLADCPSLQNVILYGCTELSDLSALVSASRLRAVWLPGAKCLRDLSALTKLSDLKSLIIGGAPLAGGVAAVTPILDRLEEFGVLSVPTATSLDALAGSGLQAVHLADCPITDLAPLATLRSLTRVWLRDCPAVDLAPLATLPHLRKLYLSNIEEPVDLAPLARTDHRLRVELRNTSTVGTASPLVKIQRY
jgi:hypothetical protein